MAYNVQYRAIFSNELNHKVEIELLLKDGDIVEPGTFEVVRLEVNDDSDEGTIIARECILALNADANTPITWESFLATTYDEWMIVIRYGDNLHYLFHGFLTPEEGHSPFLDKPYEVLLRSTNGLKLLKDAPLTKLDGTSFKGKFTLLQYVTAALSKTLLPDIPIRTYGSIYESSMQDRGDDISMDYYQQTKLDHRTFMKDSVAFENCYETLNIILQRHSRLFYWNGMWVIFFMPEHQFRPGGLYYTQYDALGLATNAEIETEGVAKVGSAELIYPINEDAIRSANFAIKTARTDYKYIIWPEIPLNNKFERGTNFETGNAADEDDIDNDGDTTEIIGAYKKYTIDDWEFGFMANTTIPLAPMAAGENSAYTRRVFNIYGIELKREVLIDFPTSGTGYNWLRSEGIPVGVLGKIRFGLSSKFPTDFTTSGAVTATAARIYIVPDNGVGYYTLQGRSPALSNQGQWKYEAPGTSVDSINITYLEDENSTKYVDLSIESRPIPVDGTLYIVFDVTKRVDGPGPQYFSGFSFEYVPFVGGGYVPVSGDYWQHTQNANMIDADVEQIKVSDTILKVAKGAFWRNDGVTSTTPTWYRYGIGENRHFKEIVNLFRFNLAYRRFRYIEGSFTGLFFEPSEDQLNKQPLSFHKEYRFKDISPERDFILIPPLQMDIVTGNIHAEFQEVLNPDNSNTVVETVDQLIQRIAGEVNNTTEDEWNDAAGAPPSGTPFFPPQAGLYTFTAHKLILSMNDADNATLTVDVNGQGNSPSVTEVFNVTGTGSRLILWELGTDIVPGNIFTLTIYGVEIVVTVQEITTYEDGTQDGDTQTFNYLF